MLKVGIRGKLAGQPPPSQSPRRTPPETAERYAEPQHHVNKRSVISYKIRMIAQKRAVAPWWALLDNKPSVLDTV